MDKMKFVDIHSHIITNVDDGSESVEASIYLLNKEKEANVGYVILTPHYRRGMFESSVDKIKEGFNDLVNLAKKNNIDIELFLGQEIYIRKLDSFKEYLNKEVIISMNETLYYLLEFSYDSEIDISEVVYNAMLLNKKVIIAHIEKYNYIDIDKAYDIKSGGAFIQVNASSIIGRYGHKMKKKALRLIKEGLVDFVASDCHANREFDLREAYNLVNRKFGSEVSSKLFRDNPFNLLISRGGGYR